MTPPVLTVYLVDDDDAIRTALERGLRNRGYEVQVFASAPAFLEGYDGVGQGCLVLDYGLPGMNGLELQAHLNAKGSHLPIIFITGHGGVPESVQAIKGGAMDFLEKPFGQALLVERIEAAFAQTRQHLEAEAGSKLLADRFARLTARELEIVNRMVEVPSQTSSKEVGAYLDISPRTVDHHRARILEKLEIKSVAELIALAQQRGK